MEPSSLAAGFVKMLDRIFPRRVTQWLGPLLVAALAALIIAVLVITTGIVDLSAAKPHPDGWARFLHYTFERSTAFHAGPAAPADLDSPIRVAAGAAYYGQVCARCHGGPGFGQNPVVLSMHPRPQYLATDLPTANFTAPELFRIVKAGVKYSAMPSWPAEGRDDEVWQLVAFLRALPKMSPAAFQAMALVPHVSGTKSPQFGLPTVARRYALRNDSEPPVTSFAYRTPVFGFSGYALGGDAVATCSRCHGADGAGGGAFPNLTLQTRDYLARTLTAYAAGKRRSGYMQMVASELSPTQIAAFADYYSALPRRSTEAVRGPAPVEGQQIALVGLPKLGPRTMRVVSRRDRSGSEGLSATRGAGALVRRQPDAGVPQRRAWQHQWRQDTRSDGGDRAAADRQSNRGGRRLLHRAAARDGAEFRGCRAEAVSASKAADDELPVDLNPAERESVEKRKSPPARVVHEIIRQQGIEELERPTASLLWSGAAAGVVIWLSLIAQAVLMLRLPDTPWRPVIAALGYSVGFVVVILGRLQLFTESTIVAVLPLATNPSWTSLGRTLRLWGLVFVANMLGTLAVAALLPHSGLVTGDQLRAMLDVSRHLTEMTPMDAFARGVPAGFILATIAWLLPNARGQEIWVVTLLTYVISLASFSHVIAGSAEAWLLATTGQASFGFALFGFILPALAGNILGGSGLFAVLAHAQVRSEL